MLSNAYFLAKFRFDTAENEPAKNLQNLQEFPNYGRADARPDRAVGRGAAATHRRQLLGVRVSKIGKINEN